MFLPRAMSSIAGALTFFFLLSSSFRPADAVRLDARSAFDRLTPLFEAELADTSTLLNIDPNLKEAILVERASFTWHQSSAERERHLKVDGKKKASKRSSRIKDKERQKGKGEIASREPSTETTPFKLNNISLRVQRGSVVAIVGPVGSGKSSLVQGLIGEMTRVDTNGTVEFGGPIAYCSQVAWIQNASLVSRRSPLMYAVRD
jgi:ATP-binding cassette subfamily C (CFTR/MRP) protein 1